MCILLSCKEDLTREARDGERERESQRVSEREGERERERERERNNLVRVDVELKITAITNILLYDISFCIS